MGALASEHSVIIKLADGVSATDALSGFVIVHTEPVGMANVFKVTIDTHLSGQALHQQIKRNRNVLKSEDNQASELVGPEDLVDLDQRTIGILDDFEINQRTIGVLDDIDMDYLALFSQPFTEHVRAIDAWPYTKGQGIVVAVVDTGVDLNHSFLAGNLVAGWDFVANDDQPQDERSGLDSNQNGFVDEGWGHGTHVAGIIKMMAPNVSVMPLRAVDSDGNAELAHILSAINYAVEHGARIINLSMSISDPSELLIGAIDQARKANVLVVASAGNRNDAFLKYPASEMEPIAVASVDHYGQKSSFSNYGREVDICAPGELVISCLPGDRYVRRSGTSMAAPMVAGEAALILELVPSAPLNYLKGRILNNCTEVNSLNTAYRNQLGRGVMDVWNAITLQPH